MKLSKPDLFIFAGEHSADLHGEALMAELRRQAPDLKIVGVGGPRMRSQGLDCLLPMEKFQVMGFIDVLLSLPSLWRSFRFLKKAILQLEPSACLFIDYPGFNLRMEAALKKAGYSGQLYHYIAPTVWAWKKKRASLMGKTLSALFVILPFEKAFFAPYPLPVYYVGHPLIQRLKKDTSSPIPRSHDKKIIAVFPGSRKKEIDRNFPLYLEVFLELKKLDRNIFMMISFADAALKKEILSILQSFPLQEGRDFELIPADKNYSLMKSCLFSLAKSGTVNLELALFKVPTIVTYGISKLDVFIATKIFKINLPHYSIVNILMGKELFPEFFGPHLTKEALYNAAKELLQKGEKREAIQRGCQNLIETLGEQSASQELSSHLLRALGKK